MAVYTTIDDPEAYFQVAAYSGTSSGAKTVTFAGETDMQADWIWFKQRNATRSHVQIDSVRGVTKAIQSDDDADEHTNANYLASFDSDGFTTGSSQDNGTNTNGGTYVAWCWKAGTTSGITTNGSTDITPSAYSFNTTSGTSIFKYTASGTKGDSVAHGLGAKPGMILIKRLDDASTWTMYHSAPGATKYLNFNETDAIQTGDSRWNDTEPDTVNFQIGDTVYVNSSSSDYIAYSFAPIQGFSNFGEYTGNVNADGVFIYLGFKPAFFIVKETGNAEPWVIYDNKRSDSGGPNPNDQHLTANGTAAESSGTAIDFVSNGVKLRSNAGHLNEGSYIYIAFAESPFVNSNGVPTTGN